MYATEMLRSGVALPAIMKLLGHSSPDMTMLYLEIAPTDLDRELHRALSTPRYLVPRPTATATPRLGLDAVIDSLLYARNAVERFRRDQPEGGVRHSLDCIANRLCKILSMARKLAPPEK